MRIQDFKEDWERGIINVPNETISLAGLSPASTFEAVSKNVNITNWFHQSLASTKQDLLDTKLLLFQSHEKRTQVVCNSLISPMLRFIGTN